MYIYYTYAQMPLTNTKPVLKYPAKLILTFGLSFHLHAYLVYNNNCNKSLQIMYLPAWVYQHHLPTWVYL